MKIYVVTTGSYSDYGIHSIFTNKNKAEECAKLLENSNDIEEYETSDDTVLRYVTKFLIRVEENAGGWLDCSALSFTQDPLEAHEYKDDTIMYGYHWGNPMLRLERYIYDSNMTCEKVEFYREKYKKAAQDIWYIVQQKLSEGFTLDQVNELINS